MCRSGGGGVDVAFRVKPRPFDPVAGVRDELADEGSLGATVAVAEGVGGVDLGEVVAGLIDRVAFIFQDSFLFHDTLAANIALARPDADRSEIERAARLARSHDFIAAYEEVAQQRLRTIDHLRHVPMGQLTRRQTGDTATVLTQDIRMIEPVLADALPSLLGALVVPVVILIATLAIDWRLGLAALATLVIAVPVFLYADRTFIDLAATRQRHQASDVARMLEYVNGISGHPLLQPDRRGWRASATPSTSTAPPT